MTQLALYTFGILHALPEHPQSRGFRSAGPASARRGRRRRGSSCASRSGSPLGTGPPPPPPALLPPRDDPAAPPDAVRLARTWSSAFAFCYQGRHGRRSATGPSGSGARAWPTYVVWWLPDGQVPTVEEAIARLEHLHDHGATPQAFSFTTAFDAAGQPLPFTRPASATAAAGGPLDGTAKRSSVTLLRS